MLLVLFQAVVTACERQDQRVIAMRQLILRGVIA